MGGGGKETGTKPEYPNLVPIGKVNKDVGDSRKEKLEGRRVAQERARKAK